MGRNYDSLNGFGAVSGNRSGMVSDYSTCNRKCKKYGESEKPPEHDCQENFYGSAKAVELHIAKRLMDKAIFQSENVETGGMRGDDSSRSTHPIIRQSNFTHASGGVQTIIWY